jgi:hypothetical protein
MQHHRVKKGKRRRGSVAVVCVNTLKIRAAGSSVYLSDATV